MSDEPALRPEAAPAVPLTVPESTEIPAGAPETTPVPELPLPVAPTWFRRLSSVIFIIFCFELGLFLLIYPWTDAWTENSLSLWAPASFAADWRQLWNNGYFRGGVSGVGLANIWIAIGEVFRMFSRRAS